MKSVPKFLIAFGRDIDLVLKNANFSFVKIGGIVHCSARNPSLTTRLYVSRIKLLRSCYKRSLKKISFSTLNIK